MKPSKLLISLLPFVLFVACNKSGFSGKSTSDIAPGATGETANGNSNSNVGSTVTSITSPNAVNDTLTISRSVDLIIALDASGSMDEERAAVSANLNKMILALQKGSVDPRIHLIAGGEEFKFPPDVDAAKVALIDQEIGSHDALGVVALTLGGTLAGKYQTVAGAAMNPPLNFRADAKLEVLVISDDNGVNGKGAAKTGNTAKDFDPANKFKATVSGVIGTANSVQAAGVCEIAAVGAEYITIAAQTGGSILDICSPDWTTIIDRFTKDVLKRTQSILLTKVPLDAEKLLVSLGGKVLARESWTYDATTRLVTLAQTVALAAGQELKVSYEANP